MRRGRTFRPEPCRDAYSQDSTCKKTSSGMIRLPLAIVTAVFYAVRWRPSVLRRVAKHNVNIALSVCDLLLLLLVIYQFCGTGRLQFQAPPYISYVGLVLAILGATIATSARLTLKHNYLPASATAASSSLTMLGPYRVIRHPSYFGSIMAFMGFELALTNLLIFITLPFIFVLCKQIDKEESILADFHGNEWRRFVARTPYKLVPYIY